MKIGRSAFHATLHFLYHCGLKVIPREGKYNLVPFSEEEVKIKKFDIEKYEEIRNISKIEMTDLDKLGVLKFARKLGCLAAIGRSVS